jgi:hypothetical protein
VSNVILSSQAMISLRSRRYRGEMKQFEISRPRGNVAFALCRKLAKLDPANGAVGLFVEGADFSFRQRAPVLDQRNEVAAANEDEASSEDDKELGHAAASLNPRSSGDGKSVVLSDLPCPAASRSISGCRHAGI